MKVKFTDAFHVPNLTLWQIYGEAASDSSGGEEIVWVLTSDDCDLPDPQAAIREVTNGRYTFYRVVSIQQVTSETLETCETSDGVDWGPGGVANQTGFPMAKELAAGIAELQVSLARAGRFANSLVQTRRQEAS